METVTPRMQRVSSLKEGLTSLREAIHSQNELIESERLRLDALLETEQDLIGRIAMVKDGGGGSVQSSGFAQGGHIDKVDGGPFGQGDSKRKI